MQSQKRRSLEDLLNDPEAQAFVHRQGGGLSTGVSTSQHADMLTRQRVEERISVSVKVPKRIADALWQAMHERTLEHKKHTLSIEEPYEKQDIVAQALEQWLKNNGYLES